MAVRTVLAVLALVRVVAGMTGNAGASRMQIGIARAMTARAAGRGVPPHKRVAGSRMIEGNGFPGGRGVAIGAIRAPRTLVGIILNVAVDTGRAEALPALSGMTRHTGHPAMGAC